MIENFDGGHHRFAFSRHLCFLYLIRRRENLLIWQRNDASPLLVHNITMDYDVPNLEQKLQSFRTLPAEDIFELASNVFSGCNDSRLPEGYLRSLDYSDQILCFRACLICWSIPCHQIPREMQLRAVLADQHRRDSLVSAGTGSGKTLPIALNILFDNPSDHRITLTISPLKRLQTTQENDFRVRYGIPTYAINEDTPRDDKWWKVSRKQLNK